jgi:hypothetical protein
MSYVPYQQDCRVPDAQPVVWHSYSQWAPTATALVQAEYLQQYAIAPTSAALGLQFDYSAYTVAQPSTLAHHDVSDISQYIHVDRLAPSDEQHALAVSFLHVYKLYV